MLPYDIFRNGMIKINMVKKPFSFIFNIKLFTLQIYSNTNVLFMI